MGGLPRRKLRNLDHMRITGTFLDEITHDIPSQNWGPDEWAADFEVMRRIGIDTVIIIRSGYKEHAIFDSPTLRSRRPMLPAYENLGQLFLELAERNGMKLWWGTYDPGDWTTDPGLALSVNRAFVPEVYERFGRHPAFGGWYLSFEQSRNRPEQVELVLSVGRLAKELTPELPTLISPYLAGVKGPPGEEAISKARHEEEWDAILGRMRECVDVLAFQDGGVGYLEMPDYLKTNVRLAQAHGMRCWSNLESFDRDMPIRFPPIDWRKLRFKISAAREAGVEKLITFEFSHFMSPNSMYPSAHSLFRRYCEYVGLDPAIGRAHV